MKAEKSIAAICLFLSLATLVWGQAIQFVELENMPSARSALTSANDGENIYLVNGFGPEEPVSNEIYKYNLASDSWSVFAVSSIPKRYASSAVVDGHLYVFNGQLADGTINPAVEKISLSDGSSAFLSNNPQPCRSAGAASWNGKIYSFGGRNSQGNYSNKVLEFNPQTDDWVEIAEMPIAAETEGVILNDQLYVLGGFNGSTSNRIDIYNFTTDTWEPPLTMPYGISAHATAQTGNRIYLVGDFSNLTLLAYFDTSDNSFNALSSNLSPRRHCAAEVIDGKLYVAGGNTSSNIQSAISSIQVATVITDTRKPLAYKLFDVYPNPVSEWLYFRSDLEEMAILDSNGRVLRNVLSAEGRANVSNLDSGLYLLTGMKSGSRYLAKWVKQ
jgi:hypothetical protein